MSKRLVFKSVDGTRVLWDNEWQEFIVVPAGMRPSDDRCYHTTDKADAIATAGMIDGTNWQSAIGG